LPTYTFRYGIVKKEGPALSPWVQGLVERTNQTIKEMCRAVVMQYETQDWTIKFSDIINTYNNKIHNTIKMTPMEAWKSTFTLDPESLPVSARLHRIYVMEQIRNRIASAGENYRKRFMEQNQRYVEAFEKNDIVLVRVPKKYRFAL
jgi:hypothetical protein